MPMPRASKPGASQYKPVRGLVRGLAVLRALNTMAGGLGSALEVAQASGLHRTTAKRLLETLRAEGLVELPDGAVRVTPGDPVRYVPFSEFGLTS